MIEIIFRKVKSPLAKTSLPCDFTANPYIGCEFGCRYCYAQSLLKEYPTKAWGEWVIVKENFPEMFIRKRLKGKKICFSTICDAYQPVEARLNLMRKTLINMDKDCEISILTKSPLVVRDIDIIKKFKKAEVGFSLMKWPKKWKSFLEPKAPSLESRIEAMKRIKKEGITVFAFVAPIIPELSDVEYVINKAKDYADYFWFEFLNFKLSGRIFKDFLRKNYPEVVEKMKEKIEKEERKIWQLGKKYNIKIAGIEKH